MINNNINLISIVSVCSYLNVDIQKKQIFIDNRRKTGIYRLTNVISGKSYVGSSIYLSIRFRYYFKRQIKNNNNKIYRAILKYSYSGFNL